MSIGITGCERTQTQSCPPSSRSPFPNGPRQSVLPITVHEVGSVAVDTAGNVYAADTDNNRVLKLAAGSGSQTVLPFAGLVRPNGLAVDGGGNVYLTDNDGRVLKLAVG